MPRRRTRPRRGPIAKLVASLGGIVSLGLHLQLLGAAEAGWMWFGRLAGSIILAAIMRSYFGLRPLSVVISLLLVSLAILLSGHYGSNFLHIIIGVLAAYFIVAGTIHVMGISRRRQNQKAS